MVNDNSIKKLLRRTSLFFPSARGYIGMTLD